MHIFDFILQIMLDIIIINLLNSNLFYSMDLFDYAGNSMVDK
jgi:hypothetical protein